MSNIETPIFRMSMLVLPANISPTIKSNFFISSFGLLKNMTLPPFCFFPTRTFCCFDFILIMFYVFIQSSHSAIHSFVFLLPISFRYSPTFVLLCNVSFVGFQLISFKFSIIDNLIEIFFFFVQSFLVDLLPFQQNHNFEDQDHLISHRPYLHHLFHNRYHRRHHILVVILVLQEST